MLQEATENETAKLINNQSATFIFLSMQYYLDVEQFMFMRIIKFLNTVAC